MKKCFLFLAIVVGTVSCTDAQLAQIDAFGKDGSISCYSGGKLIYAGKSNGKILTEDGSDGWYFKDASTGKLIRTNADCLIEN